MTTRSERWYRLLLGLLPKSLRRGFEDEMTRDFLLRIEDAEGPTRRAIVWVRAILDLSIQGFSELVRLRRRGRRERWGSGWGRSLASTGKDFRYAGRALRRDPSFTLLAVLTLALGIGGATVAFSLVNGVLLRPLPFPSDHELIVLREHSLNGTEQTLSFPNFHDFRSQSRSFQGIAALRFAADASVLGGDQPARGVVVPVSREFFSVLGIMPYLGRPILPEENRPGGEPVAVVGYEFWSRFLSSDERLENLRLTISRTSYAVVGVMPPGFKVLEDADVYLPLEQNAFMVRSSSNYRGIGRLAEGATVAQAQVEVDGIVGRIREAFPDEAKLDGVVLRPLREEILGEVTRSLFLLLGASGLLLLLTCSNVASTLLARAVRRRQEMAIRTAVGGGRACLVRLVFAESLVLAGLSGVAGVGLSLAALKVLGSVGASQIPRLASVTVDVRVLVFALVTTLLTSLAFGLLPALRLPDPAPNLRGGTGIMAAKGRGTGWGALVAGQVALAMAIVVACGLLFQSMREILSADTAFEPEGVLSVALDFSTAGLNSPEERGEMLRELKEELRSLPGVTRVGFVSHLPAVRMMMTGAVFRPPMPADGDPDHLAVEVGWRVVDEDYFRVMGIPLLEGRFFSPIDGHDSPPVVILNEALAGALFPDGEMVGSRVQFVPFWQDTDLEVVGVVAEARDWRVPKGQQLEGFVFWPQRIGYTRQLTAVLHTTGDPAELVPPARQRLRALAPNVPGTFRTLQSLIADSYRDRTFTLGVLGVFSLLSLFLSAVGIYGVVSYAVSGQAREIGIMLALGAQRGEIRGRIFLRSVRALVVGIVAGLVGAVWIGGVLESLLYQVQPTDPLTFVLAPLVLLAAGSLAILTPVFQYTRIDPVSSMRAE